MCKTCFKVSSGVIRQDYHGWLCDTVDGQEKYNLLLMDLDRKEFTWSIELDYNRAADGIELRERYLGDTSWANGEEALDRPCSVLEMLVALAERMAFELSSADDEDVGLTKKYFWEMLGNMGLSSFTDERYVELDGMYAVADILNAFVDREYTSKGIGGCAFPTARHDVDLRQMEIWYQMQLYLEDEYGA